MGLKGESILLQTLTNQGVATVPGGWIDLSDYVAGAFYAVITAAGTVQLNFQMSVDGTTAGLVTVPANGYLPIAELAQPAQITGAGIYRYPLLNAGGSGAQMPWIRSQANVTVGTVTGKVYFIGRV